MMITLKRLLLEPATLQDIEAIMALEQAPENRLFVWQGSYESHVAEIEESSIYLFKITEKASGEMVGFALNQVNSKSAVFELRRIAIGKKGCGYGKEAIQGLMAFAFETLHTNRFWLDVYPDNTIGIKLYEGLGMVREGVLRQNYKSERGYLDQIVYSVLKSEYEQLKLQF